MATLVRVNPEYQPKGSYVVKTGDTMSGDLTVKKSSADVSVIATRSDVTDGSVGLQYGSGGSNHGVWSYKQKRWLMHGDNDGNVYLAGMNMTNADKARGSIGAAYTNSTGGIYNDTYTASNNRMFHIDSTVNNSASTVNGHRESLYVYTDGIGIWDTTSQKTLWYLSKAQMDKLTGLGVEYKNLGTAAQSIASGSDKSLNCTLTLPAGMYIIAFGSTFSSNANGRRMVCISMTNNVDTSRGRQVVSAPANGAATTVEGTMAWTIASQSTLYLWCYQNSGSTLTCYPWISCMRVS